MITLHSQDGRHFLGLRQGKTGQYEIVYDGGAHRRRFVWTLTSRHINAAKIHHHLHEAIVAVDVLAVLYSGLRGAEIEFDINFD